MSPEGVYGGRVLAAFNRLAEIRRNHELMFAIIGDIAYMISTASDDTAGLRAKCEAALPLWNEDRESMRALHEELGETAPSDPMEAMIKLILDSGIAGLSTLEIRRLQEPLWPAIEAEYARALTAPKAMSNRSNQTARRF